MRERTAETTAESVNQFALNGQKNNDQRNFYANGAGARRNYTYPRPRASRPESKHLTFKDDKLIIILNNKANSVVLAKIKEILTKNSGDKKVFFKLGSGGASNLVETDFKVNNSGDLLAAINKVLD